TSRKYSISLHDALPILLHGDFGVPAGEHQDCVLGDFLFNRDRVLRFYNQWAPHPAQADVLSHVDVAVVPQGAGLFGDEAIGEVVDRKSTRLNSSHVKIS